MDAGIARLERDLYGIDKQEVDGAGNERAMLAMAAAALDRAPGFVPALSDNGASPCGDGGSADSDLGTVYLDHYDRTIAVDTKFQLDEWPVHPASTKRTFTVDVNVPVTVALQQELKALSLVTAGTLDSIGASDPHVLGSDYDQRATFLAKAFQLVCADGAGVADGVGVYHSSRGCACVHANLLAQ